MPIITASSSTTSSDGVVSARVDTSYVGVLIQATLAGVAEARVSFLRTDPDGSTVIVRGGDHARLVAGFAVAYDAEMPLGVSVTYTLLRHDTGAVSQGMAVTVPQGAQTRMLPVSLPSAQVAFFTSTYSNLSRSRRSQVLPVVGRPDPIVLDDARSLATFDFTAMVTTDQQPAFDQMLEVGGTFLLQPSPVLGLPRMYVRAPTDSLAGFARTNDPFRPWQVGMAQVARPSTVGSPLRIPGKSYRDRTGRVGDLVGTYKQRLLA